MLPESRHFLFQLICMSHNLSLMNQKVIRNGDQNLSFCMGAGVLSVDFGCVILKGKPFKPDANLKKVYAVAAPEPWNT